jgi:hypothetical protein
MQAVLIEIPKKTTTTEAAFSLSCSTQLSEIMFTHQIYIPRSIITEI